MKVANLFHFGGLALIIIGFSRQMFEKNDFNLVLIGIVAQVIGLFFYYSKKLKNDKNVKK